MGGSTARLRRSLESERVAVSRCSTKEAAKALQSEFKRSRKTKQLAAEKWIKNYERIQRDEISEVAGEAHAAPPRLGIRTDAGHGSGWNPQHIPNLQRPDSNNRGVGAEDGIPT